MVTTMIEIPVWLFGLFLGMCVGCILSYYYMVRAEKKREKLEEMCNKAQRYQAHTYEQLLELRKQYVERGVTNTDVSKILITELNKLRRELKDKKNDN